MILFGKKKFWEHDCNDCEFMGSIERGIYNVQKPVDIYFHEASDGYTNFDFCIIRESSEPHENASYPRDIMEQLAADSVYKLIVQTVFKAKGCLTCTGTTKVLDIRKGPSSEMSPIEDFPTKRCPDCKGK